MNRKKFDESNFFVYIFVVNCQFYQNNSSRTCPKKLKTNMICHMNNTFQNIAF